MASKNCFSKQVNHNVVFLAKMVTAGVITLFPLMIYCIWSFTSPADPSATLDQIWQRFNAHMFWLAVSMTISVFWSIVVGIPFVTCFIFPIGDDDGKPTKDK